MPTAKTSRLGYAQSSDIKSRTWEQYREDMKRKAIVELECRELLQSLLEERSGGQPVTVEKHGVDAVLWFNPQTKPSGEPDYRATFADGTTRLYEFKHARKPNLRSFDINETSVHRPGGPPHTARTDREIFYIARTEGKYGFLTPEWIMDHGPIGPVPAWGNRPAYRVPRKEFLPMLGDGGERLQSVIRTIEDKELLLSFQSEFLESERRRLSGRLRRVIDESTPFSVVPKTLNGFFEACFLVRHLKQFPDDAGLWLVHVFSLLSDGTNTDLLARAMYAIDCLYFRAVDEVGLREDEHRIVLEGLPWIETYIDDFSWSLRTTDPHPTALEELRHLVFVVNLVEDVRQDVFYRWGERLRPSGVKPTRRIFESIPEVAEIARRIREAGGAGS